MRKVECQLQRLKKLKPIKGQLNFAESTSNIQRTHRDNEKSKMSRQKTKNKEKKSEFIFKNPLSGTIVFKSFYAFLGLLVFLFVLFSVNTYLMIDPFLG